MRESELHQPNYCSKCGGTGEGRTSLDGQCFYCRGKGSIEERETVETKDRTEAIEKTLNRISKVLEEERVDISTTLAVFFEGIDAIVEGVQEHGGEEQFGKLKEVLFHYIDRTIDIIEGE